MNAIGGAPAGTAWICEQADMLLARCPFVPAAGPFLLAPETFDRLPIVHDRVRFLIERFRIPADSVAVHVHGNMKEPGKVVLRRSFDPSGVRLGAGQEIASIEQDGTYTIRDKLHPGAPSRIRVAAPLPRRTSLAMYLNQAFIAKETMGAIIAHETAHLYLDMHGIQKLEIAHDLAWERRTDIAAFVMGLGELMLRGCVTERTVTQRGQRYMQTQQLGYLSPEEMRFVHDYVMRKLYPPPEAAVAASAAPPRNKGFWRRLFGRRA